MHVQDMCGESITTYGLRSMCVPIAAAVCSGLAGPGLASNLKDEFYSSHDEQFVVNASSNLITQWNLWTLLLFPRN